ncbi:putative metal-binding protein, possibly nucleic-acid binding [Desulfosporosinus youngiae DSM 17734]|uniref:Putative metal-binding protein, possibly nucleic-acid binding n=2 Tax=Desulfosporosinus TaxID=79206 RepID=H5XYF9_9FIRM|nr:putative metal-binding protein, possibly nucleic-acid binding [Desulfosporosinus youngiae DSM 17734]
MCKEFSLTKKNVPTIIMNVYWGGIMKVNVAQVRLSGGETVHYDLVEDFSAFDLGIDDLSFQAPVHVQLQVNNTRKAMLVKGTIHTKLNATCGRCLEPFVYTLDLPYEDEWAFRWLATEDLLETALLLDKDEIDIKDRIFEQIVLALPMKFTCSVECQGLCPNCGANRNLAPCNCGEGTIDPRLAALAKWQSND